jgi:hypothetical protein
MKPNTETHFFRSVWRNAKGIFSKPPKNEKRPPKGWAFSTIAIPKEKKKPSPVEIYTKSVNKDLKRLNKTLQKKVPVLKASEAKTENLELRFKTDSKSSRWKKISKPRKGSAYQIAIFKNNKFLGYWRNSETRKITPELVGMMAAWKSENRFPTDRRIKYLFEGETLKDALRGVSFDGAFYKARILLNVQFTAKDSDEIYDFEMDGTSKRTLRYNHNFVIECVNTFGQSYDEFIREQILKHIAGYFKESRVRFTSGEVLQEFNEVGSLSDGHFQDLMELSQVFDVKGNLFAQIL